MGTLNEDLSAIKEVEDKIVTNKVARFAYTDEAYKTNNADGVAEYNVNNDQNIPTADASVLKVNETVLSKGYRAQASSVTRMLLNHFFGRMSYNLNKVNDIVSNLIATLIGHRGTANGFATLDENGRIPYSQLPESVMEYKGQWNAETNTPTLADGTGTKGDFYIVSVAGTQNLGSGNIQFSENDRIIYDGSVWSRLSAGGVKTVNSVLPTNGNVALTGENIPVSATNATLLSAPLTTDRYADSSVTNAKIKEPISVAKGGTGKTTTKGAQNALLSDMQTETTAIDDSAEFVMKYGTPTDTKGALFKRSATLVWNYIKDKISSVLGLTKDTYGGKASTAGTADKAKMLKSFASWSNLFVYDPTNGDRYFVFKITMPSYFNSILIQIYSDINYALSRKYILGLCHSDGYGYNVSVTDLGGTISDALRVWLGNDGNVYLQAGCTWSSMISFSYLEDITNITVEKIGSSILGSNEDIDGNVLFTPLTDPIIDCGTIRGVPSLNSASKGIQYLKADVFTGKFQGDVTGNVSGSSGSGMVYTCQTASTTREKTVSIPGFTLTQGACIRVVFSNGNSVAYPTLNVNGTGAKEIRVNVGGTIKPLSSEFGTTQNGAYYWKQNVILELYYNGSYWVVMNDTIVADSNWQNAELYISGRKKIWGYLTSAQSATTTTFAYTFETSTSYSLVTGAYKPTSNNNFGGILVKERTPTSFKYVTAEANGTNNNITGYFIAEGY